MVYWNYFIVKIEYRCSDIGIRDIDKRIYSFYLDKLN